MNSLRPLSPPFRLPLLLFFDTPSYSPPSSASSFLPSIIISFYFSVPIQGVPQSVVRVVKLQFSMEKVNNK